MRTPQSQDRQTRNTQTPRHTHTHITQTPQYGTSRDSCTHIYWPTHTVQNSNVHHHHLSSSSSSSISDLRALWRKKDAAQVHKLLTFDHSLSLHSHLFSVLQGSIGNHIIYRVHGNTLFYIIIIIIAAIITRPVTLSSCQTDLLHTLNQNLARKSFKRIAFYRLIHFAWLAETTAVVSHCLTLSQITTRYRKRALFFQHSFNALPTHSYPSASSTMQVS